MMEALSYSETSVLSRATRRNIPEYGILHSDRRENLKSYCEVFRNKVCKTCSPTTEDNNVRFDVFTAITITNAVFWDMVTPCFL
jgi:hypothetical protein